MPLTITGGTFTECGTAIDVSHGTQVTLTDVEFTRCQKAFEERDPQGLAAAFGLPADTPPKLIVEALQTLKQCPDNPEATLKKAGIWSYIERAANAASVIQALAAFVAAGFGIPAAF